MKLLITTLALVTLSGCSVLPDLSLFGDNTSDGSTMTEVMNENEVSMSSVR